MNEYEIVFEKFAEASAEMAGSAIEAVPQELDEIAELGQAVVEIMQPPPIAFTVA